MCLRSVALATTIALLFWGSAVSAVAAPGSVAVTGKRAPAKKAKSGAKPQPELPAPPLEEPPKAIEAATSPPPSKGPPTLSTKYRAVAVLPFEGSDVGEAIIRAIEQALINEIDDKGGFRAVSPRDVVSEAASYDLAPSKCVGEDVGCWAQVARYARAHLAIVTRVASLGGVLNLSLRLLDAQTSSEVGRVAEALSDKADERAAQMHRMAIQLLAPAEYVGTLIIKSDEASADIYLNDKLVGTTPLKAPLKNLAAGPYILHVTKEGFADVYQFVDVAYNRVSTITVSLATNTISGAIAVDSDTGFGNVYVISDLPEVEIRIDGEPKGMTPLEGAITQVPAGSRRLSLRRGNAAPLVRELPVEKGKRTDVGVSVQPDGTLTAVVIVSAADSPLPVDPGLATPLASESAAPVPATRRHPLFTTGLVVAGAGVVALGVGAVFASQVRAANNDARDYERTIRESDDPEVRAAARAQLSQLNEDGPGKERRQWIALGVGGGLLLTGGLIMAADHWQWFGIGDSHGKRGRDDGFRLGLVPAPGGGMVSLAAPW